VTVTITVELVDTGAWSLTKVTHNSAIIEEERQYSECRAASETLEGVAPAAGISLRKSVVHFCVFMASLVVVLMIGVLALSILADATSAIAVSAILAVSLVCFTRTIGQVAGGGSSTTTG
jgi:hypothetical protein